MSDSLPPSSPDNEPQPGDLPAENVPEPQTSPEAAEVETQTPQVPDDPEALAADRAGFKFLAIGFAIFFVLIAVCASIVALVMKSMGI